ncbi:MAG: UvrD-helicase domain-containing protein, partial [Deltaproteobacteria bacterium]|nr:UvrD-helicase domain-containing protein [Deltaproteobacteria bacterium]
MPSEYNQSQTAVLDCRENFCVTAGAGSGKTGTIVEYVIRHVERDLDNNSILEVLALTFSEKAAAEMGERVSKGIRERLKAAKRDGDVRRVGQWEREFRRLGQAQIGTIHGYAFGLVKNYSHLLGLPTNLDVNATEFNSFDLSDVLRDLLNENNPDLSYLIRLLPLVANSGPSITSWLRDCVTRMNSWGLSALRSGVKPSKAEPALLFKDFSKAVASASNYVESSAFDESKYPLPAMGVRGLVAVLENLGRQKPTVKDSNLPLLTDTLSVLSLPKFLFNADPLVGQLSGWRKKQNHNHKAEINEPFEKLKSYLASMEAGPVTQALVNLANLLPPLIRAKCLARGQISFDDMLSQARHLLKNHADIRAEEAARWKLIIIDEFQDTNRLQADLIAQLIPESGRGFVFESLDWPKLPSKLRVVGDPKQSIYRFRGSEPSIMANLSTVLGKGGGRVLFLDTNYRTQPRLISFFNAFFPSVLSEPYEDQKSIREQAYEAKPVVCLTDEGYGSRIPAEAQAALVVSYLTKIFDGRAKIFVADKAKGDGAEGAPRLPRPGDVALLLRRRKNADIYQAALTKEGWPCHTLKGQDLFDIPEITGLASAYLYLCGRSVDLNLAAAITSPLGPVSEETLTRLVWPEAPRKTFRSLSWYFEDKDRPWPTDIYYFEVGAMTRLRRLFLALKPYALRRPPGEIIEAMVEDRNLLPLLVSGPEGSPDRVRNIQYFIDYIKTIPLSDPNSPDSAADIIENLLQIGLSKGEGGDDSFAGLPDEGSINIMTVHRAKGLEFPIVVVPEADIPLPRFHSGLKISDDGRVVVRFRSESMGSKLEPPEFNEFKNVETNFDRAESMRLLYVAATRARDHLVFVGQHENPVSDSWLRALKGFDRFDEFIEVLNPSADFMPTRPTARSETAADQTGEKPESLLERFVPELILPAPLPEFTQLPVTQYCRICQAFENGAPDYDEASRLAWTFEANEDSPLGDAVGPREVSATAAERGTVFHAVMEVSTFDLDILAYKNLVLDRSGWLGINLIEEEVEFLAIKALRFQTGEYGQELKATMDAGRFYRREWPFWLNIPKDEYGLGPILLSGVIDLFYVNEKGQGRLIDFKLAKPGPSFAYEKQLEIYSLALKKAGFTGDLLAKIWYSGP